MSCQNWCGVQNYSNLIQWFYSKQRLNLKKELTDQGKVCRWHEGWSIHVYLYLESWRFGVCVWVFLVLIGIWSSKKLENSWCSFCRPLTWARKLIENSFFHYRYLFLKEYGVYRVVENWFHSGLDDFLQDATLYRLNHSYIFYSRLFFWKRKKGLFLIISLNLSKFTFLSISRLDFVRLDLDFISTVGLRYLISLTNSSISHFLIRITYTI